MKINLKMDEKFSITENGKKVLGIMLNCRDHGVQRTVWLEDGIGCSKCYGKIKKNKNEN